MGVEKLYFLDRRGRSWRRLTFLFPKNKLAGRAARVGVFGRSYRYAHRARRSLYLSLGVVNLCMGGRISAPSGIASELSREETLNDGSQATICGWPGLRVMLQD